MMDPFRCQVCGEVYLGQALPDRCPFCGAAGKELIGAALWVDYGKLDLTSGDQDYVRKAIDLEKSNTAFYKACADKAETRITESIFKRLSKQEAEHAELLETMLGEDVEAPSEAICPDDDSEKFAEAHRREKRAIRFYLEAASKADHPRLRAVMHSLSDIESEHLKLSNIYK
jgi:rubrerythrin